MGSYKCHKLLSDPRVWVKNWLMRCERWRQEAGGRLNIHHSSSFISYYFTNALTFLPTERAMKPEADDSVVDSKETQYSLKALSFANDTCKACKFPAASVSNTIHLPSPAFISLHLFPFNQNHFFVYFCKIADLLRLSKWLLIKTTCLAGRIIHKATAILNHDRWE